MSEAERTWIQSLKQGVKVAVAEIGHELQHKAAHGAHELAAALFTGSAFVMYPRNGVDQEQHNEPVKQNEPENHNGMDEGRGGRGR